MQKFIVELIGVFTQKDLPEDYEQFVEYKATIENKEITEQDKIAVLRVKDTTSYQVFFLNDYDSLEQLDKEVDEKLDGKIYNFNIRKILEGHING